MEPRDTGFFQSLNIATKIVRGQIDIQNPLTLIKKGAKINQSASDVNMHLRKQAEKPQEAF